MLGGCNLSVSGMNVKYCHKGQIVSDRQKNEEILGLIMEAAWTFTASPLMGERSCCPNWKRGLFWGGEPLNEHGISDGTPVSDGYHIGDDAEKPASGGHGEKQ